MNESDKTTLKARTVRGAVWASLEMAGGRGVQFVVGIILARLLAPEQFGLIGMLTIFMALSWTFIDSGFGAALIQKKVITEQDSNSIFYFNILVGLLFAGACYGLAPSVAAFYAQPILTFLLRAMAVIFVINAFGMVQGNLLIKAIDFKTQTLVTLMAGVVSGVVGVTLALRGWGVWSLVAQQLSQAVFRVSLLWLLSPWRPAWMFRMQSLREMFGFSSRLLCTSLIETVFSNIYLVVIGKLFSPVDLGLFSRADNLQKQPSLTFSRMMSRVMFPVFSTIQDDPARLKRSMKKTLATSALINFPLMIGLMVVARPLVVVLLTEKWLLSVPYLQVLCLVGLMYPLQIANLSVMRAMGRSDLFLRVEVIKKGLIVLNIAIAWRWGILAMIYGQVIVSQISYYLDAHYNKALIDYSPWQQVRDLYPYLLNTLVMGAAVYAVTYLPWADDRLLLVCQLVVGVVVYIAVSRLFRLSAYLELQEMVVNRLRRIRLSDAR